MADTEGLRKRKEDKNAAPAADAPKVEQVQDADDKLKKAAADVKVTPAAPKSSSLAWIVPFVLTLLAFWTRFYKISWADFVVWDEAHFGKFASYYIKREFYFDVHPPLGKVLLGLSGHFVGYNGSFEFESGAKYPAELNYAGMRIFCAVFGALMVPLAYYTGVQLKMSKAACALMAAMVLQDTSLLAISRFILLDSMLLFFTALSAYCLVVFRNLQVTEPLSRKWYIWLGLTGFSIGCVASVKWVGLFAIALVGLHTIEDLWVMLGDVKMPWMTYMRHWIARIVLLIALPIAVYVLTFAIHFELLNHSGTGDAQMSSLFQANLLGNNFHENPIDVAFGSKLSLKNNGYGGGLLHSHVQTYPSGSEQQQVTCYHHKDANNEWIIKPQWDEILPEGIHFVKNGSVVRLVHEQTGRNLHSHVVKAPVSVLENEVSCYGNETVGDINDLWEVQIVDAFFEMISLLTTNWAIYRFNDQDVNDRQAPPHIKALTTRFLLRHVATGCLLRSGSVTLPQWGFKQAEVVCQKAADVKSVNNMWNVELHVNPLLPPGGPGAFKKNFWKDFVDLNVAMWTSNNALTPDPDKEPDLLTSKPYQWPLLLVGLRMCGWGDDELKFYLVGHPIIWLGSTASLVVFVLMCFVYAVRAQRKCQDFKTPALYFAIILFTFVIDHIGSKLPSLLHTTLIVLLGIANTATFIYFADLAFGIAGPASAYAGLELANFEAKSNSLAKISRTPMNLKRTFSDTGATNVDATSRKIPARGNPFGTSALRNSGLRNDASEDKSLSSKSSTGSKKPLNNLKELREKQLRDRELRRLESSSSLSSSTSPGGSQPNRSTDIPLQSANSVNASTLSTTASQPSKPSTSAALPGRTDHRRPSTKAAAILARCASDASKLKSKPLKPFISCSPAESKDNAFAILNEIECEVATPQHWSALGYLGGSHRHGGLVRHSSCPSVLPQSEIWENSSVYAVSRDPVGFDGDRDDSSSEEDFNHDDNENGCSRFSDAEDDEIEEIKIQIRRELTISESQESTSPNYLDNIDRPVASTDNVAKPLPPVSESTQPSNLMGLLHGKSSVSKHSQDLDALDFTNDVKSTQTKVTTSQSLENLSQEESLISKPVEPTDRHVPVDMEMDEPPEPTGFTSFRDMVNDWSIKTEITIFSKFEHDWCQKNSDINVHKNMWESIKDRSNVFSGFQGKLCSWVYPSSKNAPSHSALIARILGAFGENTNELKPYELAELEFFRAKENEWRMSFQSLFSLFTEELLTSFYYMNSEFSVIFQHYDGDVRAIMSKSTYGTRKVLQSK
ncbi:Protein O-mannosyltransferase 2, partial [Blyttiomyces sp. JEL0837]